MMHLFLEDPSPGVSEMSIPAAAEMYSLLRHPALTVATGKKQLEEILVVLKVFSSLESCGFLFTGSDYLLLQLEMLPTVLSHCQTTQMDPVL